jgi:glyoxalase superfamily protein
MMASRSDLARAAVARYEFLTIEQSALGARRADIGQTGAESWTVLADPEENEFCVV